ncbi:MAG: mechanosensitive ion channel [Deltaproteobacteria bacterium]|nr:MAG: mechanosensitive ion channel [Deltaproteobacteria bacterium]
MMRSEMKPKLVWTWVIALLVCAFATTPSALAQDEPERANETETEDDAGTDVDGGTDVDAGVPEEEEHEPEAASDAKRIMRIRQVIDLDTQRLRWLRSELGSRTRWFEDLAAGMAEVAEERNVKKESLEALEADPEADAEEVAALRGEVEELQEDYGLYDTQTDLALKAEKAVRKQIEALEKKIAKDELVLGKLTGEIEVELPEAGAAEPTAPAKPTEAAKPTTPIPVPVTAPGPGAPPAPKKKTSSAMTAAQLQAQRTLARKQREVEISKIALSDFVERKRALQRQIEFEEGLAKNDAKEIENLERVLEMAGARLEKYREAEAPPEKIQRRERSNREIARLIKDLKKNGEERAEYIESLIERLAHLEEAELRVTEEVDAKQEEASKARRRVTWLESPIHPKNIQHWAKERGPRILIVIAAAVFLLLFVRLTAQRIARTVVGTRRGHRTTGTGRADTLAFSFRSASRVLIVVFGVLLVLQEAGVDIKTVLGGAAIIGVAIAFGAQDLMKDYFSGFLILAEDQYQLGDLITIRGITGTVESVNMRVTVLRDLEGRVHFIPNGSIDQVTNRTYAWGRPVFEIPVGFGEDVDKVMETLVEIAKELRDDPDWKGSIIGDPEMLGVDKFTEFGAVIKFMVKTQPDMLFAVRREMLRRISKRFKELRIQITVPQRILLRDDDDAEA